MQWKMNDALIADVWGVNMRRQLRPSLKKIVISAIVCALVALSPTAASAHQHAEAKVASAPHAVSPNKSKPIKARRNTSAAERRSQVNFANLLGNLPRKASDRAIKEVKKALPKPGERTFAAAAKTLSNSRQPVAAKTAGLLSTRQPKLPPKNLSRLLSHLFDLDGDPYEGAVWGSIFTGSPTPPSDDGKVTTVTAATPVDPALYVDVQPGETTWSVSASYSGNEPLFARIQLFDSSSNALVATGITNYTNAFDGTAFGSCQGWQGGVPGPGSECDWNVHDGALTQGKSYYAKLSFATQTTLHYYQLDTDTFQQYLLPTAWTAAATSLVGPANTTPGVAEGEAGQCTCSYEADRADPVNTATGAVTENVTDVAFPGSGATFSLTRYYRSDATSTSGLLGKGWSLSFEAALNVATDTITLVDSDGAQVVFTKGPDGTFTAPRPIRYTLTARSSGYSLKDIDGNVRIFDADGRLTAVQDSDGHGLALAYTSGVLSTVTDTADRTESFDVDPTTGELRDIALHDGRSVRFGYVGGQLTTVTGTDGGTTTYTYNAAGQLATTVDANDQTVAQNTYDAATGRISSQIGADGKETHFAWTPNSDAPNGSGESDMTAPDGGVWTDVYQAGVLMESFDPVGSGSLREYDTKLNVAVSLDGNFVPTQMTYDSFGNISTATVDDRTEKWDYDESDRLKIHIDGRGFSTTYAYDGASTRLKTESSPTGTTTYTYTASGQVETETTPAGAETIYGYDADGNQTSVTDPDGDVTTSAYDSSGRLKAQTDPRGNVDGADKAEFTTTYEYDASGRLKTVTDALGHATSYTYDDNGNVKTVTDPLGNVTAYGYDAFNRQTSVEGPDHNKSTTEYDSAGNVTASDDQLGNRTTYGYDDADNLVSMTTPRGNVDGADKDAYTTTYGYDGDGNQISEVDPSGAETDTVYDDFGQIVSVTDPLGQVTATAYDDDGDIASTTDPLGNVTTYTYDDADRQKTVRDPLGNVTTYGYDSDGHRTSETTPMGYTTTWTFDPAGRMHTQVDPRGNEPGLSPADFTTTYAYDAAGNQISVTDALGHQTVTAYDADNNPIRVTDPLGNVTSTEYDELARISKITAPDQAPTTYMYNSTGTEVTRTDANGHKTTYDYNDNSDLTSVTDPLGRKTVYGYDPDGNNTTITDARGITATTGFDGRNLPTGTTYSDNTASISYTYTPTGLRQTATDATGSRTYGYDADGHLTSVTPNSGAGAFAYTYDADGRLSTRARDYTVGVPTVWSPDQMVSLDVGNNGTTDLASTGTTDSLFLYGANYDGTIDGGSAWLSLNGSGYRQLVPGDFTGDGNVDLLEVERSDGHLILRTSNGTLSGGTPKNGSGTWPATDLGAGWDNDTLVPGDFTGDGKLDILAQDVSDGHLYLHSGTGTGTFGPATDLGAGFGSYRLTALDFNGDGKQDLLAVDPSSGHLYFYPGTGSGTFGARVDLGSGWGNMQLVAGDFNGDGKQDVLADDTSAHKLYFYPSTGQGTFGARITEPNDWTGYGIPLTGHFDDGASLDIAAIGPGGRLFIFHNAGNGLLDHPTINRKFGGGSTNGAFTTYGYDADGRQDFQLTERSASTYSYDAAGDLTGTEYPNGYTESRGYDADGILKEIDSAKGSAPLSDWQLRLDADEQPTRVDETRAGKAGSHDYYTYDQAGRLLTDCTSTVEAEVCPTADAAEGTTFTYDGVGNRTTATIAGTETTYQYDAADQLRSSTEGTTTAAYSYDADGNETGDGSRNYTYDGADRLTSTTTGGNTYTYGYDSDGNRTTMSQNGTMQRATVWDTNYGLPQVAAETIRGSNDDATTSYAYNPLEQVQSQYGFPTDVATTYYDHDPIGSVTDLTDSVGNLLTSYSYSAYGESTQTNVADDPPDNPFTYAGQYADPSTGDISMRARNYDPTIGRFTSHDPLTRSAATPGESTYVYASDDPTDRIDPAGTCPSYLTYFEPCGEELTGGILEGAIRTIEQCNEGTHPVSADRAAGENRFWMEENFIFKQMKHNITTTTAKLIRYANDTTIKLFGVNLPAPLPPLAAASLTGDGLWVNMEKPGGQWDHKPIIAKMAHYNYWAQVPGLPVEVFYDVWSNIHYGYVGRNVGFGRNELNYGQQMPGAGHTDAGDIASTVLGMDLWDDFGSGLTFQEFDRSVIQYIRNHETSGFSQIRYARW
jgi:RHS repeat-associated protein